jgi:hypothetical protein
MYISWKEKEDISSVPFEQITDENLSNVNFFILLFLY